MTIQAPIVKTLHNGLKVVFTPFKNTDSLNIKLIGKAGSYWEKRDELGVAHFLEHVVHEGTKKYPSDRKLGGLITNTGGFANAYTSQEVVAYYTKTLIKHLDESLDYLSQLVTQPILADKEIEKHRSIILQELKSDLDVPVTNFFINSRKIHFPKGHRQALPIIGTHESLENMTREKLKRYLRQNYTAANFALGICSNLDPDTVFNSVEKYFKKMPKGRANGYRKFNRISDFRVYAENNKEINQATLSVIFNAPSNWSDHKYATNLLNRIFGYGEFSKLFTKIRQKNGLAYDTGSYYGPNETHGVFELYAQIDEENIKKVIKIMKNEIRNICERPISHTELERTKSKIISNFVFKNEKPETLNTIETSAVLFNRGYETYDHELSCFGDVTVKDIQRSAKKIFSQEPRISLLSKNISSDQITDLWYKY